MFRTQEPDDVRVVEVVPYDDRWISAFHQEELSLREALGNEVLEVHHVGSTAIPGIWAKPTIDILVVVRDISAIDGYNLSMSKMGYVAMGEYGIKGRRFFIKGGNRRTHHVHIFERDSSEIDRHLLFRDFMIAHPAEAANYAALKQDLAARFRKDIDAYCEGKDAFIREIDAKAQVWGKSRRCKKA